jgi:hypothetical protein
MAGRTKVYLVSKAMNVIEYRPICDMMINWLNANHISYNTAPEDWSDLPTVVWFDFEEDAVVFRLRFGI